MSISLWPDGKSFAFSIFDDTDLQTLSNAPPVYDFLHSLGMRTTKSVWTMEGTEQSELKGATCEDPDYRAWVQDLQSQGFEIALHNVSYHTTHRDATRAGIDRFCQYFGHYPYSHANHSSNAEGIYWGDARLSGVRRSLYNGLNRFKTRGKFEGHLAESELFWGDLCKERIRYVRNFVYGDINTLKVCPYMPYHDSDRPYVNYWFAASEGGNVDSFVATLSEANQDRLELEGGACIMYTHFACGFYRDGELHPRFKYLMERLSRKNGWFVPVSTLLDYLAEPRGGHRLTAAQRDELEWKWLYHKTRTGVTA